MDCVFSCCGFSFCGHFFGTYIPRRKEIYKKYAQNIKKIYPKIYFQNIFDGEKYITNYDEKYIKNMMKIMYFCCLVLEP